MVEPSIVEKTKDYFMQKFNFWELLTLEGTSSNRVLNMDVTLFYIKEKLKRKIINMERYLY